MPRQEEERTTPVRGGGGTLPWIDTLPGVTEYLFEDLRAGEYASVGEPGRRAILRPGETAILDLR